MNLLPAHASPTVWPWFRLGSAHFSPRKLTRRVNLCVLCSFEMVDIGAEQIIYKCFHPECRMESYKGQWYLARDSPKQPTSASGAL